MSETRGGSNDGARPNGYRVFVDATRQEADQRPEVRLLIASLPGQVEVSYVGSATDSQPGATPGVSA